jgi:hypothetical protein
LENVHRVFSDEHLSARERHGMTPERRQLLKHAAPLCQRKLGVSARVGSVVTLDAPEIAPIGKLQVHFLNVKLLPIKIVKPIFDFWGSLVRRGSDGERAYPFAYRGTNVLNGFYADVIENCPAGVCSGLASG